MTLQIRIAAKATGSLKALPGTPGLRRLSPRILAPLLLVLFSVLTACSTVPYSERTRVILIPEAMEMQMGEAAYQQVLAEGEPCTDPVWVGMVERAGRRIAAVADRSIARDNRPPFAWEFAVLEDAGVNAFCLPGGKVAFLRGILPICETELGVAVVMGHEIAHALARHGGERVSQSIVLNLGISVIAATTSKDEETRAMVAGALGVGFGIAFALPFSREHESEADYIGLMMMAEAGYDPREAPRFWQRMADRAAKDTDEEEAMEFLSTHPATTRRIEDLEADMAEALQLYEQATGEKVLPPAYEILRAEW